MGTMTDELINIDTTVLDQFLEVTRQQRLLDELQARAEQGKAQVDESVYRRVVADYAARVATLSAALEPVTLKIRAGFDHIRASYEQIEERYQRALLEKQELEFRQHIGEIDAVQAAERLAAPTQAIRDCQTGMARLDDYRSQFAEAVGSEEALFGITTLRIPSAPGSNADARRFRARGLIHVEAEGADAGDYELGAVARIGRSEENDICIQSRGLSRQHAVITATARGFVLRDLESQNGTTVNGAPVTEHALADGDLVTLGDAKMRFSMPSRSGS